MPGNARTARAILDGKFHARLKPKDISSDEKSGCSREVYRVGKVVYKLNYQTDNEIEYACLTHFADREWASPVSLFDIDGYKVLCMPFYPLIADIDPDFDCVEYEDLTEYGKSVRDRIDVYSDSWRGWADTQDGGTTAEPDFHHGNYRILRDGTIKIIDAAGTMWHERW